LTNLYQLYPFDCIHGAREFIKNDSIDLIITDPPYGINANQLHKHYHRREDAVLDGYVEIPIEDYPVFSKEWIAEAERALRPGGSLYIISGYSNLSDILNALRGTKLNEINHIIWKYNFGVHTKNKYISSHYHILYYTKPGGKVTFNTYARIGPQEKNENNRSVNYQDREDVWVINREYKPGEIKNKNELPLELIIKIMQYSSNEGDLIADFFLGGFNTAKVAIGMNRRIVGFEINNKSFEYHINEIARLKKGYLLPRLRKGMDSRLPVNQHKRWTDKTRVKLNKRYQEIYDQTKHKRQTIKLLEDEFGRGYFSILNQLEQMQRED
jgi:site-specific DNA-methyltransferase (adenine-specific)